MTRRKFIDKLSKSGKGKFYITKNGCIISFYKNLCPICWLTYKEHKILYSNGEFLLAGFYELKLSKAMCEKLANASDISSDMDRKELLKALDL